MFKEIVLLWDDCQLSADDYLDYEPHYAVSSLWDILRSESIVGGSWGFSEGEKVYLPAFISDDGTLIDFGDSVSLSVGDDGLSVTVEYSDVTDGKYRYGLGGGISVFHKEHFERWKAASGNDTAGIEFIATKVFNVADVEYVCVLSGEAE